MQNLFSTLKSVFLSPRATAVWIPFMVTFFSCPLLIHLAPATGLFDYPKESKRKIHISPKPLAGPALLIGFLPIYLIYVKNPLPLTLGLLIVFFTGIADDLWEVKPKLKLFFHAVAALLVVSLTHLPTTTLSLTSSLSFTLRGTANSALICFWLVGGTNGFNLIDGLDGLAVGIGIISLLPLAILTASQQIFFPLGALIAALVAILLYNFHPARLFLGDGGSYLIGFLASYLVVKGVPGITSYSGNGWSLVAGLLLLGVPIIDTSMAIGRRIMSNQGVMEADQDHIHHYLYRKFGHVTAVLTIYGLQVISVSLGLLFII